MKLAQAVRTPAGIRLRHAAVIQRPSPWSDADALALDEPDPSWPEILAALECGDFRGRNAACLLPMNVCELRGLKVPQGDVHERRAMIANELADDEAERHRPMEFDFWELGGEKGIETSDGFNVNVMSVTRPWIDQVAADCQQARLDCWAVDGAPLAMARAVGLAARSRSSDRAVAVDWGFSNTTICVVGRGRPLYARRLHDCHFRKCLAAIEDSLGMTRDHAQHLVDVHGVTPADADARQTATDEHGRFRPPSRPRSPKSRHRSSNRLNGRCDSSSSSAATSIPTSLWLMGGGASVRNIGPLPCRGAADCQFRSGDCRPSASCRTRLHGPQAALFGPALALSALAWRAA